MLEKRQAFTFVWGFSTDPQTVLQSCTPAQVNIGRDEQNGSTAAPVPPYTLIAYPETGVPTVDLLGVGPLNMAWTPRFPPGTKILINVVDALGNSGGIAQQLYALGTGTSTACVASPPAGDFKATLQDFSGSTLQTCDTLPIHIQGGSKPYTVTLAATNSASATNVTLDASNDYYQWINRMAPGQSFVAAISDSTGRYAATTQFLQTAGTTDTACTGKQSQQGVYGSNGSSSAGASTQPNSSSSGSSSSPTGSTGNTNNSGPSPATGAIIGTIVALLAILAIVAFFFFRRRKARRARENANLGMQDYGYKPGGNMPGNDSFLPLNDGENTLRTPGFGSPGYGAPDHGSAFNSYGRRNPSHSEAAYNVPPSDYSGTGSIATSMPWADPHQTAGAADVAGTVAAGAGAGVGAGAAGYRPQTKREMIMEEQERSRQRRAAEAAQSRASESVYPPNSTYNSNPFGDNVYPYQGGGEHEHARSGSFGATTALASGPHGGGGGTNVTPFSPANPSSQQGTPLGTSIPPTSSRPSGSQDLTPSMTPAARAKAAEAAQEQRTYLDNDDDDLLAYMTQPRMVLGVTNPDRASVATSATGASGARASNIPPAGGVPQVYQHEDAGGVVELPPAYREFAKTPGPGAASNLSPRRP